MKRALTKAQQEIDARELSEAEQRGVEASALVERAKSGDPRAFEELVRRYRPRIFALALHLTGRRSDADDITQDAFLRAYAKIQSFQGRSEFFTWLYRIALHRALNIKRNRGRRKTVDIEDPRIEIAVKVDAQGDPRRALELQDTYAHLLAAFDSLSPLLRTTVVLTVLQGLSYKEAAVVLDSTEGTIAWRVHEARSQMKGTMERLQREPTTSLVRSRAKKISDEHELNGLEAALALLVPSIEPNTPTPTR